jgi:hypothetical protein
MSCWLKSWNSTCKLFYPACPVCKSVQETVFLLFSKCINGWDYMGVRFMVFNATFNNISVISWWSVLLVEETAEPGENHRPVTSH